VVEVVAIAAVARNGVIGAGNDIPWRIREDWARFQRLTMGHVLVMGRKTYDSIGRPLPGRTTVVVTRNQEWSAPNVLTRASVSEALALAEDLAAARPADAPGLVWVVGGGEIYRAAWERLDRLEITEVDAEPAGDVTFPPIDPAQWRETDCEEHVGFRYRRYRRIGSD
jgi:dihydrofolate reductase